MKVTLVYMKMNLQGNTSSYEWFRTQTRFETEAQGNSEMVYFTESCLHAALLF